MEIILLLIRLLLFAVFALAGIGKLLDLEGSEKALKAFGTPEEFAKTFAVALPFAEIVFAVCFLFTETSWLGAIGALILLLSFIGGMIWQISQGKAPDCHCFGQIHSEPVGRKTLIRNIGFAVLALALVAQGRDFQGLNLADTDSGMIQTMMILALLVLSAVIVYFLKSIHKQQEQIIRRMDILEALGKDGTALERSDAGDPGDGLPIGSPFPDFELPDIRGRRVVFNDIISENRPTLFFFVSPTCEPCKSLLPEIEAWRTELENKVNFVFVSSGKADENLEKFSEKAASYILLQKDREVAESVVALWTPTALFVGAEGKIASHPAAGDTAIRELVEKIKAENLSRDFVYFTNGNRNGRSPKIGERIPEFSLTDIKDREINTQDFLGKTTLAVFWSLGCPYCRDMVPELKAWEETRDESAPHLVIFSDGENDEHHDMGLESQIVIEKNYATATKMGMQGTPSAVLINEKGEIVSETAAGAARIWALLGKRKLN